MRGGGAHLAAVVLLDLRELRLLRALGRLPLRLLLGEARLVLPAPLRLALARCLRLPLLPRLDLGVALRPPLGRLLGRVCAAVDSDG